MELTLLLIKSRQIRWFLHLHRMPSAYVGRCTLEGDVGTDPDLAEHRGIRSCVRHSLAAVTLFLYCWVCSCIQKWRGSWREVIMHILLNKFCRIVKCFYSTLNKCMSKEKGIESGGATPVLRGVAMGGPGGVIDPPSLDQCPSK